MLLPRNRPRISTVRAKKSAKLLHPERPLCTKNLTGNVLTFPQRFKAAFRNASLVGRDAEPAARRTADTVVTGGEVPSDGGTHLGGSTK